MSSELWGGAGGSTGIPSSHISLSDEAGPGGHCILEAAKEKGWGTSKNNYPKNVLHIGICESLKLKASDSAVPRAFQKLLPSGFGAQTERACKAGSQMWTSVQASWFAPKRS